MMTGLRGVCAGFLLTLGLATGVLAADDAGLQTARQQIAAGHHRAALQTLRSITSCTAACKYTRAVAYSRIRDRHNTATIARELVADDATPAAIKREATKLLDWAQDARVTQTTGRRVVRRRTLGGYALSNDDNCSLDSFARAADLQQWQDLGVDPSDIPVPPDLRPCDVGPPIVHHETYRERCEAAFAADIAAAESDAARAEEGLEVEPAEDDLDGYELGGDWNVPTRPMHVILEGRTAPENCTSFAPPDVALADAGESD